MPMESEARKLLYETPALGAGSVVERSSVESAPSTAVSMVVSPSSSFDVLLSLFIMSMISFSLATARSRQMAITSWPMESFLSAVVVTPSASVTVTLYSRAW